MKAGLLERILTRRYGLPRTSTDGALVQRIWSADQVDNSSILYVGMKWHEGLSSRVVSLRNIYGDSYGGFLVGDSIKVSVLLPRKIYGLWRVYELQMLAPVRQAREMDPAIEFFMDSANVWYYGYKDGDLYVFDAETDELDSLGPVEPALVTLMDEWEDAKPPDMGS